MKKTNLTHFILSLLMFSPLAFAHNEGGKDVGNGGDFYEIQFKTIGRNLVDFMKRNPKAKTLFQDIDLTPVSQAIEQTEVVFTKKRPRDRFGNEKSMVNVPEESLIKAHIRTFEKATQNPAERLSLYQLVIHEYFGIAGVEIGHYAISDRLQQLRSEIYNSEASAKKRLDAVDRAYWLCTRMAHKMALEARGLAVFNEMDVIALQMAIFSQKSRILNETDVLTQWDERASTLDYAIRVSDKNGGTPVDYQVSLKRNAADRCYTQKLEKKQ